MGTVQRVHKNVPLNMIDEINFMNEYACWMIVARECNTGRCRCIKIALLRRTF